MVETNTQNTRRPVAQSAHNENPERRSKINTQEIERVDRFMSEDNKANGLLSCKKERNELDGTGQQQQLLIATTRKRAGIEQYGEEGSVSLLAAHKHMLCATKIPFASHEE